MTDRKRVRNCGCCKPVDRAPFTFYFGPWDETVERWKAEGIDDPMAWQKNFPFDKPIVSMANFVNYLYCPAFEPKVLERHGDHLVMQDWLGEIVECVEGKAGIPKILKSPVNNHEEWEALRRARLTPHDPRRYSRDLQSIADEFNDDDSPVQIGAYPCGLYGTLRDMMGVEGSLFAFYDQPDLVHAIMDGLTDIWLEIYADICRYVKVDIIHIWEDMSGKQGSLLSPDIIREFMLPNYKRLRQFADAHDIAVIQVDTDGNCEQLIPLLAEGGITMMMPFEVQAGCDVVELRKKYPYMSMMGGINKLEIAKGKEAIDRELARIEPLLFDTGYMPALDHLIPPEISYENYSYFVNRLHDMIIQ